MIQRYLEGYIQHFDTFCRVQLTFQSNQISPIQRYAQNILFDLLSQFTVWGHISSSHRDTKILDENVNSFLDSFAASSS